MEIQTKKWRGITPAFPINEVLQQEMVVEKHWTVDKDEWSRCIGQEKFYWRLKLYAFSNLNGQGYSGRRGMTRRPE